MRLRLSYTQPQVEIFFPEHKTRYTIVKKGRRFGFTHGAANAFIEYAIENLSPLLWVDTINGNIDRYFDRYFLPALKQAEKVGIPYKWSQQKRELKINGSIIDFRSADNPQNIEGFGYRKILLNEAGIILTDDYLYNNAILPMMLDFPDSELIAGGVPKGKYKKDGEKHKFYELWERCEQGNKDYRGLSYSSYSNPLLKPEDIKELEGEIPPEDVQQEIYGEFVDKAQNYHPFLWSFSDANIDNTVEFDPNKQIILKIDFNIDPFCLVFGHYWEDKIGHLLPFEEYEIKNGSIDEMAERINSSQYKPYLGNGLLTGDALGKNKDISQRDLASLYKQLITKIGMSTRQLRVSSNPTHRNSRADCNYFVKNFDFRINGNKCPGLVNDCKNVQVDAFGEIIKKNRKDVNQRADFLDAGLRYPVHNLARNIIYRHMK